VRDLLAEHHIRLKKSLGQNFLVERNAVDAVTRAAQIGADDVVLEIGAGIGHLTRMLAQRARQVIAVEVDARLIPLLTQHVRDRVNCSVVHGDILADALDAWGRKSEPVPTCVVANVPYHISTPILTRLITARLPLRQVTLTLQREAAERFTAPMGSPRYGAIALGVQYWGQARIVSSVARTCFFPVPGVDSVVLRIVKHATPPVPLEDATFFFEMLDTAFAQPRKMLRNTLQPLQARGCDTAAALTAAGIDGRRRAATLCLADAARLSAYLRASIGAARGSDSAPR